MAAAGPPKPVRARALDPSKPLPVLRAEEDREILNESAALPRLVANIATGMEKAEEEA